MRDPERIDVVLKELEAVWKDHPDWRLGQLIVNAYHAQKNTLESDPFYIEDDELLQGIKLMGQVSA